MEVDWGSGAPGGGVNIVAMRSAKAQQKKKSRPPPKPVAQPGAHMSASQHRVSAPRPPVPVPTEYGTTDGFIGRGAAQLLLGSDDSDDGAVFGACDDTHGLGATHAVPLHLVPAVA